MGAALAVVFAAIVLAGCSGKTIGATNVTATSANLWANGECDQSCTVYLHYRPVGSSAWTDTAHLSVGKVTPAVSWYVTVSGLTPETTYEYQVCGQEPGWSGPVCVGPDGAQTDTQTFVTAPASQFGVLTPSWSVAPDSYPYAARAVVYSHTVYIGSWDGDERAYDESGNLNWVTSLGQETGCPHFAGGPYTQGITAAAAIDPATGTLYVSDGSNKLDALNLNTGAVLWSVPTDTSPGNYDWSSPVIYSGHVYIGTASMCDDPLTQGKLLSINLTTHQIDDVFKVVPDGQVGGGIWSTPVVDPTTNTVFVTTGTQHSASQTYAESIIALDATTMAVKGHWQIPNDCHPKCGDLDWGATPTLLTDSSGRQLIASADKNGVLYAFDRNNISAGPLWQDQIAVGGAGPQGGKGSISPGVFDGKYLYYAGGNTTIGGQAYAGAVRAVDPATGKYVWQRGLPSVPLAALTIANGEVVVATEDNAFQSGTSIAQPVAPAGLYLVNAATGNIDYANPGEFYSPPTVADGLLFEGDIFGNFSAFQFPSAPGQPSAAAPIAGSPRVGVPPRLPNARQVHPIHIPGEP